MSDLSILIPSLYERFGKLSSLTKSLYSQIEEGGFGKRVEVLIEVDSGEMKIGAKRNKLLADSNGKYIAFVDDDDRISSDYIKLVLQGIDKNVDCCSLVGQITTNGKNPQIFKHSVEFKSWYEKNGVLYRCPNHLNCVKTSIALKVGFPEINHGEDRAYSEGLQKSRLLKKEHKIDSVIYFYDFISGKKQKR